MVMVLLLLFRRHFHPQPVHQLVHPLIYMVLAVLILLLLSREKRMNVDLKSNNVKSPSIPKWMPSAWPLPSAPLLPSMCASLLPLLQRILDSCYPHQIPQSCSSKWLVYAPFELPGVALYSLNWSRSLAAHHASLQLLADYLFWGN